METLSYYGARFVGGDSNCNVTFQMTNRWALAASDKINQTQNCMCRQRMDDMTYSDDFFSKWVNRSGRGPTLEWIDSPNLDCPLSRYFHISSMSQLLLDIQNVKNWQFAKESSILVFISLFCKSHRNFFSAWATLVTLCWLGGPVMRRQRSRWLLSRWTWCIWFNWEIVFLPRTKSH